MLHLAAKAEGKLPLHDFEPTDIKTQRDLTVRKSNLVKFLSRAPAGEELAASIDKVRGGECRLDIEPSQVKVLDVDGDDWTVDSSEF